ncbi:thermatolerance membrane protein Dlt1 [Ascosphaera apis ARSEF 7405]|uniref:Defect at low temperature protein 1 n=1 Tax=Ascosphaera apis ARSEF 7405 TaxID=392613 RepID=A0A167Z935_9EURO|nr:thermatolerance membrane protein Dlt1 [Ascosphaera apis ARSEF 7405]
MVSSEERMFSLFYTGSYTCLSILSALLTLISPGDMIYQSITDHSWKNIFVIVGVYLITLLVALFLYGLRMWTNKKLLAEIPKSWIPIDRPDVALKVHDNIMDRLVRSAIIAQQSRPRDCVLEERGRLDPYLTISRTGAPPWGRVEHSGWTSPSCTDLPNCRFWTVIVELPYVLEARAVSFASELTQRSPDSHCDGEDSETRAFVPSASDETPDEHLVKLLARPKYMCLRSYLNHLTRLGMLKVPALGRVFIRSYEAARFYQVTLAEEEFRSLLNSFAQLLRELGPPDPAVLENMFNLSGKTSPASNKSYTESDDQAFEANSDSAAVKGKLPSRPVVISRETDRQIVKKSSSNISSKSRFVLDPEPHRLHGLPNFTQLNESGNATGHMPWTLMPPSPEGSNHSHTSMQSVVTAIRIRRCDEVNPTVMSREPSIAALEILERIGD